MRRELLNAKTALSARSDSLASSHSQQLKQLEQEKEEQHQKQLSAEKQRYRDLESRLESLGRELVHARDETHKAKLNQRPLEIKLQKSDEEAKTLRADLEASRTALRTMEGRF